MSTNAQFMAYYLQSITMWDFTCNNIGRMGLQRKTKIDKGPAEGPPNGREPIKGQRQAHSKGPP